MYSKLHCFIHSVVVFAIFMASLAAAHAQAPSPDTQVQAGTGVNSQVARTIADPTGRADSGRDNHHRGRGGQNREDDGGGRSGAYVVTGLAPGSYMVTGVCRGLLRSIRQPIQLAAGQVKRVDISMAIEVEQQSVVVTDESPAVNVEAGGNANAIVLKGKDLDALSDDPDELSNELTALAGPSAGPNGGQIYIDGFSGGQLPPKSAIREIRINQNPFSAEFDRLGYGRIEILTKPGTDKLHGQFFIQGNDKALQYRQPVHHDHSFLLQLPVQRHGERRDLKDGVVFRERRTAQHGKRECVADSGCGAAEHAPASTWTDPNYGVNLLNRRIRDNASARIDWQLGAKNTFTARYGFWSESEHGDLNSGSLPSASTHESNTDHTVQMSDAIIINDHAVNESRFQYERQNENHYPDSTDRTIISVRGISPAADFQARRVATTRRGWSSRI